MFTFHGGFLTVGHVRGIPVRIHWSAPAGALLFTGLAFRPGAWLGFGLLILLHELGHAYLVRRYGLRVLGVDMHALGGVCHWSGATTPRQRATIAWGGVLAQALLLVAVTVAMRSTTVEGAFARDLVAAWTEANLWMILLNLVPFPPFDGAQAWPLLRILAAERRGIRAPMQPPAPPPRPRVVRLMTPIPPERPEQRPLPPLPDDVRRALDRIVEQAVREAKSKRNDKKQSN